MWWEIAFSYCTNCHEARYITFFLLRDALSRILFPRGGSYGFRSHSAEVWRWILQRLAHVQRRCDASFWKCHEVIWIGLGGNWWRVIHKFFLLVLFDVHQNQDTSLFSRVPGPSHMFPLFSSLDTTTLHRWHTKRLANFATSSARLLPRIESLGWNWLFPPF